MDDGLGAAHTGPGCPRSQPVSILLVMDDGLGEEEQAAYTDTQVSQSFL